VISAWVVKKQGATLSAEEVRDFCRGRIAHYKIPHYVQVVDQLPRTVTGKVRKHVLREQGISTFGLHDADSIPTA
jgi:fatty-acyl-CoA synthase